MIPENTTQSAVQFSVHFSPHYSTPNYGNIIATITRAHELNGTTRQKRRTYVVWAMVRCLFTFPQQATGYKSLDRGRGGGGGSLVLDERWETSGTVCRQMQVMCVIGQQRTRLSGFHVNGKLRYTLTDMTEERSLFRFSVLALASASALALVIDPRNTFWLQSQPVIIYVPFDPQLGWNDVDGGGRGSE